MKVQSYFELKTLNKHTNIIKNLIVNNVKSDFKFFGEILLQ